MTDALPLVRDNISAAVAAEVRKRITDGRLAPGARLNEVRLAEQLGVSRTPLREALARLAHEGALETVPRIGYSVRPLTVDELRQIYAIRPLIEPEALRLAGIPAAARLARLAEINRAIEQEEVAEARIALDDEFHLELIDGCPNKVLIDLIKQFIGRTRRYELAYMADGRNVSVSVRAHRAIVAELRRRKLAAACRALRGNLEAGFEPIAAWLRSRETSS